MHRQPLGSPSPRPHGRSGVSIDISPTSPSLSSPSTSPVSLPGAADDVKLRRRRSSSPPLLRGGPEKYVHLIPILTLLCFLVLFLCSHEPSPIELADFNGFNHKSKLANADTVGIDELERVLDEGEIIAIRSLRNLQEIGKEADKGSRRSHRKLGDF